MKQSNGISFNNANSSLSDLDRELTADINARAAAAGYTPFIKAVGKEPGNYKIEYKTGKPATALFVLRITGNRWSLRCKLHHIGEYAGILENSAIPRSADCFLPKNAGARRADAKALCVLLQAEKTIPYADTACNFRALPLPIFPLYGG